MGTTEIFELIEEIRLLVQANVSRDGVCRFDPIRVRMALKLVKLEIEKSIQQENFQSN